MLTPPLNHKCPTNTPNAPDTPDELRHRSSPSNQSTSRGIIPNYLIEKTRERLKEIEDRNDRLLMSPNFREQRKVTYFPSNQTEEK